MATNVQSPHRPADAEPHPADEVRYVARQPILDLHGKVHAYELLFSDGTAASFHGDREEAARTLLDNTVLFGLERLTAGLPAFVKCTAEMLSRTLVEMLPAGITVLEIPDSLAPEPSLIAACRHLKTEGFRLALDDFVWKPDMEPLVAMADYIKVDFSGTSARERQPLLGKLSCVTVALLAKKVETQEQYRQAREEGFTLIQGYYFCRPALLENRKVPANRLSQVEILRLLQDESLNLQKLTQSVKRDASLTYRLLRLINSPACAMQQEVHSVQAALLAVGEDTFRRLATLAITSELNAGQTTELLRMAFVRGRFCELAAMTCQLDCTEQYLLGLMSLLSAMLRQPMTELTPLLPLREKILRALKGEAVAERCLLGWLEQYERGDWVACNTTAIAYKLEAKDLLRCYKEAVEWAEAALRLE